MSADNPNGLPFQKYKTVEEQNKEEVFRRGVMKFEDFNYETYNKYIFHLDPNEPKNFDLQGKEVLEGFIPKLAIKNKKRVGGVKTNELDDDQSLNLTDANLETSCKESYKH